MQRMLANPCFTQSFADPMNNAAPFHYPNTTGIAYSFTDDGYFEEAQYRFLSNGGPQLEILK